MYVTFDIQVVKHSQQEYARTHKIIHKAYCLNVLPKVVNKRKNWKDIDQQWLKQTIKVPHI
jgi:hypothetical protein